MSWCVTHQSLTCLHRNKSQGALAPHSYRYTSRASKSLQELNSSHVTSPSVHLIWNSKLLLGQTDGATERANRSVAQILHTVVSNDQRDWSDKCLMVEFAINSSINATTGYAPFELNYGYMPRSGQHILTDTMFKGVKQFAQQAVWNLMDVHNAILEHRIEQVHYSNKRRQPSIKYQINDLVYLLTKNLTLPKHRARKLMPKFIAP